VRDQHGPHPSRMRLEKIGTGAELVRLALSSLVADFGLVEVGRLDEFLGYFLVEPRSEAPCAEISTKSFSASLVGQVSLAVRDEYSFIS
jgi:hypothetical protein